MKQAFKLYGSRYDVKSVVLCMALTIGSLLFFTDYCRGQASAQHVGYEIPGELDAYEILPPNLLEGKNYWVDRRVVSFGFTNRYTIYSHFGKFEAHGDEMLRTRQQEIRAIESLREIKRTKAFGDAVKKAVKSPIKGAKALISNPVDTVKGVPKGVGRFFGRIGEMVKGGRGDQEESAIKELIGFSATKRQYAHKFGVDVYSSNEVLQKELNSVSWAGFAGGVGVKLAMMPVRKASQAAYMSIQATRLTYGMNMILLDSAPEDLRRMNREKLVQMGVREYIIEEFLHHPAYSPRHETILVHALAEMKGVKNRGQFIKQALSAEYEEEAFLYQRMAEMLHGYHTHVKPIREIIPVRRLVVGYTSDQSIIATIPLDYLYWTERADHGSAALVQLNLTGRPIKKTELWITGTFTPRTMQELNSRGIVVRERVSEELLPQSSLKEN
ncbi:MAG: hypothetical protein V3U19_09110 [Thermodesulfobacteriota bacterium]